MGTKRHRAGGATDMDLSGDDGFVSNTFSYILDLPTSLCHDILFRLPIKDVLHCKCVCKSWHSLISKPDFSEIYHIYSKFTSLFHLPFSKLNTMYLVEISEDGYCSRTLINPRLQQYQAAKPSCYIVGSCNGFTCFVVEIPRLNHDVPWKKLDHLEAEIVHICNPIMGRFIELPRCERRSRDLQLLRYHFGHNLSGNNYKVLRIVYICKSLMSDVWEMGECQIFTIGVDDRWRGLSLPSNDLCFFCDVFAFCGNLNWIPMTESSGFVSNFDLAEEKLGKLLVPSDLVLHHTSMKLTELGNKFALVDCCVKSHQIDIWVMENYPVAESWTKQLVVMRSWLLPEFQGFYGWPLKRFQDGNIIFAVADNYLMLVNMKQKKSSKIDIFDPEVDWTRNSITYSPNFSHQVDEL